MSMKCPGCGKAPIRIEYEPMTIHAQGSMSGYRGLTYVCGNLGCRTILGTQIDPFALNSKLLDDIKKAISRRISAP